MRVMREKYPSSRILFIAGDGLSLMRMNHLLASEYDEFLDQSPAVVPIQGGMRPLPCHLPCSPATCPARGPRLGLLPHKPAPPLYVYKPVSFFFR